MDCPECKNAELKRSLFGFSCPKCQHIMECHGGHEFKKGRAYLNAIVCIHCGFEINLERLVSGILRKSDTAVDSETTAILDKIRNDDRYTR